MAGVYRDHIENFQLKIVKINNEYQGKERVMKWMGVQQKSFSPLPHTILNGRALTTNSFRYKTKQVCFNTK